MFKATLFFLRVDHPVHIPAVLDLVGGLHAHPLLQGAGQSLLAAHEDGRVGLPPELRVAHEDAAFGARRLDWLDFPRGGFSPPEGRLARGCKPPAFSRFLFQSAVEPAEILNPPPFSWWSFSKKTFVSGQPLRLSGDWFSLSARPGTHVQAVRLNHTIFSREERPARGSD